MTASPASEPRRQGVRVSTVAASIDALVGAHVDTLSELFLRGSRPDPRVVGLRPRGRFLNFAASRDAHLLLRPLAKLVSDQLAAGSFVGWQGLVLDPTGDHGANQLGRREAARFRVTEGASLLDAGPAMVLIYEPSGWPLAKLRDEIRLVAPGVLLGRTYFGDAMLSWFALEAQQLAAAAD